MKVSVEELSPIERKLHIEVPPDQVEAELKRAYAELGRRVKIPGFRPGKVPRRILEQRYRAEVEADVTQRVVEINYLRAVSEKKVDVVANPKVSNARLQPGQAFAFEARVEVKPVLTPKSYEGLALKKVDATVPEDKVNERIEQIRQRMGSLEPLTGRDVAQAKDYAVVDYEATVDGKPFPGNSAQNVTVQVAPGELVESNIAALEGVKVGDKKEVEYAFPKDFPQEELRGKVGNFVLHLKGLKHEVTPELNDEFAKDVGGGATVAELRAKVRADLEAAAKLDAERAEREALLRALVEANPFEAPKSMVDRAVEAMLEGGLRNMIRAGADPRQLGLDFGKLREELKDRATLEVKGSLILEAIALKEKIEPTDAELGARIDELAKGAGAQAPQLRAHYQKAEERRTLALRVREDKTVQFLKSRAAAG
jgi:trigger factor